MEDTWSIIFDNLGVFSLNNLYFVNYYMKGILEDYAMTYSYNKRI